MPERTHWSCCCGAVVVHGQVVGDGGMSRRKMGAGISVNSHIIMNFMFGNLEIVETTGYGIT